MIHHRQRLAFGLEAGQHLAAVHAGLDDLQGHLAADRLFLLGHKDDPHAPFADLLAKLVGADDVADLFRILFWDRRQVEGDGIRFLWGFVKRAQYLARLQQSLDGRPERIIVSTDFI